MLQPEGEYDYDYVYEPPKRNREMKPVVSVPKEPEPTETIPFSKRCCNFLTAAASSPEIPLFLYFFAIGIFQAAQQRLITGRICLYKFRSEALCQQLQTSELLLSQKEEIAADFMSFTLISSLCTTLPLIVIAVAHGSLCDRFGHRASMVLPHIGDALLGIAYIVFSRSNIDFMNPVNFGFVSILSGISGSWAVITTACSSYACLDTPPISRTVRLALLEAAVTTGQLVAYFMNGLVFKNNNFYLAFFAQIALHLYAVVYVLAMVKELHSKEFVQHNLHQMARGSWLRFLWVPSENFPAVVKIFTKHSENRPSFAPRFLRWMLVTYLLTACLVGFKSLASAQQDFLQIPPILMTQQAYALFMATCSVTMTVALVGGIRLLRIKPFDMSDAGLGMLGMVTRLIACFIFGLADFGPKVAPWIFCALSMFATFPLVILRSGMSKLADDNKQGRLFAVLCQVENFSQSGAAFGFTALFTTLAPHVLPSRPATAVLHGFTFIFAGICMLLPMMLLSWLAKKRIPNWSYKKHAPDTYNWLEENPVN